MLKIVLCGPPHSGKSCLRYGLKEAIKRQKIADIYPYVITACPDGEGSWFHETSARAPEEASSIKRNIKQSFTWKHAKQYACDVERCNEPLTIIDIGGKVDCKNRMICKTATHAVILYKEQEDLQEWREFCGKVSLKIFAEIHSQYNGSQDMVSSRQQDDGILRGTLVKLERGDKEIPERPAIKKLAEEVLALVQQN